MTAIWHELSLTETKEELQTDLEQGLSLAESKKRQEVYGLNTLKAKKQVNPLIKFLAQFHDPLIYILIASSFITAFIKDIKDAIAIFAVVLLNAIIGYIQESKAEKATEALNKSISTECNVIRDSKQFKINPSELVPGDLVFLQAGDKVPADIRIVFSRNLQSSEAVLTGESLPVDKSSEPVLPSNTLLGDRSNMLYSSTLITSGQARGVVALTGNQTEIGKISDLIANVQQLQTPLTAKIAQFSKILLFVILGLSSLCMVIGLARGGELAETFMSVIALMVSMIPEGLPAALSVTLAIGVSRMAKKNAIIRKMSAVETLGSTTIICSDKTGTLTKNEMTVQEIFVGGLHFTVKNIGYEPKGEILRSDQDTDTKVDLKHFKGLSECLMAGFLCNDSRLAKQEEVYKPEGDPTEAALLVSAYKAGIQESLRSSYPRIDLIPFNSDYKYMATMHSSNEDNKHVVYIKGSIESIIDKCQFAIQSDGSLGELKRDSILQEVEKASLDGMRVLAFAKLDLPSSQSQLSQEDLKEGLIFLGLQAMIDPRRSEAILAVSKCQDAGIMVKMITGDHPLTALSIARKLGIKETLKINPSSSQEARGVVLTGADLSKIPDDELKDQIENIAVFARVSPEQKLKLVQALQEKRHIVAMTGDGVNDAPALKQADIGVAMGITGTDVSKEAARMILTDDNFQSIEAAVEEGRCIFDNLVKLISWMLPTNLGIGLIILVSIIGGLDLPLLPIQVLFINMTTAGIIGISLAFEEGEKDIMKRQPRSPDAPILSSEVIWRIVLVGLLILGLAFALYYFELSAGTKIEVARTEIINLVMSIMTFYLFNSRSLRSSIFSLGFFTNKWVIFAAIFSFLLQICLTYLPFLNKLLSTAPIDASAWLRIFLLSVASFLLIEIFKIVQVKIIAKADVSKRGK